MTHRLCGANLLHSITQTMQDKVRWGLARWGWSFRLAHYAELSFGGIQESLALPPTLQQERICPPPPSTQCLQECLSSIFPAALIVSCTPARRISLRNLSRLSRYTKNLNFGGPPLSPSRHGFSAFASHATPPPRGAGGGGGAHSHTSLYYTSERSTPFSNGR